MDRREALKRTAWIMGGVVSAPAIMGVLKGCVAKPTIDWKPVFLSEDQGILVSEVAEIIIPKTDTPGAKETGVPGFIDLMLKHLTIKNYALIKHLALDPSPHLNVITGETGAGKSIMLGAMGLLMGNRADSKVLWDENQKCVILLSEGQRRGIARGLRR